MRVRDLSRREWITAAAAVGGIAGASSAATPESKVALARCPTYGAAVTPVLRRLFDSLGGIGRLVSGKTVAIKINMCSPLLDRTGHRPAWFTRWSHPDVIGAAVRLFGEAGAARIRILESSAEDDNPLEENFLAGGWDPRPLLAAAQRVEMENTGSLGYGKRYHRITVPARPYIYPGFDVNHSYVECDVLVSISKLKEHRKAGLSLTLENMVGITPPAIYGDAAPYEEPAQRSYGARTMLDTGHRQPPATAPAEVDPSTPRESGYRIPRVMADLVRARPVHLAILDGIETQTTAEVAALEPGDKRRIRLVKPGILLAGLNPVSTDAVAAAVMGFDPMSGRGGVPFEACDSMLQVAEEAGIGTRDLARIEIVGARLQDARFPFFPRGSV